MRGSLSGVFRTGGDGSERDSLHACGRIAFSMTNSDGSPATPRRRHVVRLVLFAAFLLALFYRWPSAESSTSRTSGERWRRPGPAAPLAYVVVSAVLGAVFVPGPILAAGSGVLFGPLLGTFVTLGATVGHRDHHLPRRPTGRPRRAHVRCSAQSAPTASTRGSERGGCGRSSANASCPASPMRWRPTHSVRSESRCGRWPSERSSARRRAPSSTPRSARRSQTCRRPWRTSPSECGA